MTSTIGVIDVNATWLESELVDERERIVGESRRETSGA